MTVGEFLKKFDNINRNLPIAFAYTEERCGSSATGCWTDELETENVEVVDLETRIVVDPRPDKY